MTNQRVEYPGYKYCFIDTETTGLDPQVHSIHQLTAIITDPNLNELETFNIKFAPWEIAHFEQSALDVGHVTLEELKNRPTSFRMAYASFQEFLHHHCAKFDKKDKLQFVGYNAPFDAQFVRSFFEVCADRYFGSWFWNPPICVMQASAWYVQRVRGALPDFKLGTMCQSAGISWDQDGAHDALYDVRKTIELFRYLQNLTPKL